MSATSSQHPQSTGNWRPRWHGADWGILLFGMLALLAASPLGQAVAIVAMISIVGLPIYIALAALPTLFFAYLFLRLVMHGWAAWRAGSLFYVAIFAVLAVAMADFFVVGAWRENARLDARVAALRADDRDALTKAENPAVLALVTNSRNQREADRLCDELCQRLLLNGEAKRVLVYVAAPEPLTERLRKQVGARRVQTVAHWPALAIDEAAIGKAYWLQAAAACGDITIPDNLGRLTLPPREKPQRGVMPARETPAAEAMRLRIANGECLMSQDAPLAQADAAILYGTLASGPGDFAAAHDPHADTINAWRIAFFERRNGRLAQTYRATSARYLRFPYARAVSYVHGYQFAMKTGLVRVRASAGDVSRYSERPGIEAFVMERLALRLHLDPQAGPAGSADALSRILSSSGPLNAIDAKVAQDYIGYLQTSWSRRDFKLADDDVARVLRIAAERRVTLPWSFSGAVALVARDAPGRAMELADILFSRLAEFSDVPPAAAQRGAWYEGVRILAQAIAQLPDDVLRQYRGRIESLSKVSVKRDAARRLMDRMSVFGPDIAPVVFAMLDSAMAELERRERRGSREDGAEAYVSALASLCRLGDSASSALAMLRERTERPGSLLQTRQRDRVVATFARLGVQRDDLRRLMQVDGTDDRAMRNFDNAWRKAIRDRPCD